jgi:hypothetical protein
MFIFKTPEDILKHAINLTMTAMLLLISSAASYAAEGIYGSAGLRAIYSEDEDVSQSYYKAFTSIGWQSDVIDLSASYNRWINYSISDELYNNMEININQPGVELTIYAGDLLSLSGGYSYLSGDASYSAHKFSGDIVLYLDIIDISIDSSVKNTEYNFNGIIKNSAITAGGEISFNITDSFSWDLGYLYEYTDYITYGYTYTKNSIRAGILTVPVNNLFMIFGASGGRDSDKVSTVSFDAGLTLKLFEHVKLSAAYIFTADFISSESLSSSGGRRSSSSSTSTDTEIIHTGNVAVSLYF